MQINNPILDWQREVIVEAIAWANVNIPKWININRVGARTIEQVGAVTYNVRTHYEYACLAAGWALLSLI